MVVLPGTCMVKPKGIPCLSAVIRVNSLDEEPVWTPVLPPYAVFTA